MRNAWIWIVVIVLFIGGGLLWWQNSQTTGISQEMPIVPEMDEKMAPSEMVVDTSSADVTTSSSSATIPSIAAEVKEITVSSKGFTFTPNQISVKTGDRVKVTYTNGGGTHDFRIEGYDVGTKVIQGGQSESFEFTADKAGTFEFFCGVGNHRAMGMKGTFTVTP